MRRKYSLQIAISTLFIALTLLLGAILSWQSYQKTSAIMLQSADELYERITRELTLDFKATYGSIAGGLRQFRLSPVTRAESFEQRVRYLSTFQAVLDSDTSIFAAGVGYPNGDYLGVSLTDSDYVREKYQPPEQARFIVFYLKREQSEPDFAAGQLHTIYYDRALNRIGRGGSDRSDFDPRTRPWYQQAKQEPSATRPYLFYDSKVVGLTAMTKTPEPGVVVVFDITLENLSRTISKYQVTPDSEVVLINAQGQTFAYADQDKVVVSATDERDGREPHLANLRQLDSTVLAHVSSFIEAKEQKLDFEFDGRKWIGSARVVARPGGVDLYALMLSPVDELLVDAVATRDRLLFIAMVVLIIFIPIIWYVSEKISKPLHELSAEADAISRFDFEATQKQPSFIKEVAELDTAVELMKSTINRFIQLINSLAGEQDLDVLLKTITRECMQISKSDAALIYLMDEQDDTLKANYLCDAGEKSLSVSELPALSIQDVSSMFDNDGRMQNKSRVVRIQSSEQGVMNPLLGVMGEDSITAILLPLLNRNDEVVGLLCFIDTDNRSAEDDRNIEFIEALSGFAAVTLESRQLFSMQEALLHAFIKLIAGAIDAKSPYTGGHCQRVPEITLMLAKAACASDADNYAAFDLDEKQWEELSIACWLHDCGKVTTPEYVVDKATKLETIYDRIHEVRTRFEVLKRDAEIDCWQQIAEGGDRDALLAELERVRAQLDDDFAFIAECNLGGEFMADDRLERLRSIAQKTWMRTIDDRLGLSWEELNRKTDTVEALPVEEKLLADKAEHRIERHEFDRIPQENPWGFDVDTPEYKYNRGELYNLSVQRGTLSEEERYMINGHMIQTIIMLNNLPFPRALRDVPLIAGSHHETMDGKGYPKKLVMSEQPLTARMMVIADIFEALTASDRPYKKAKTLSESLRIMSFMRDDQHFDADLFDLFLTSGVYLEYAEKYLSPEQIDDVDIEQYIATTR